MSRTYATNKIRICIYFYMHERDIGIKKILFLSCKIFKLGIWGHNIMFK